MGLLQHAALGGSAWSFIHASLTLAWKSLSNSVWTHTSAGIPWLESKYKQYVLMRERVLTETQNLRDKLLNAVPEPQQPQQRGEYLGKDFMSRASRWA